MKQCWFNKEVIDNRKILLEEIEKSKLSIDKMKDLKDYNKLSESENETIRILI